MSEGSEGARTINSTDVSQNRWQAKSMGCHMKNGSRHLLRTVIELNSKDMSIFTHGKSSVYILTIHSRCSSSYSGLLNYLHIVCVAKVARFSF